ncbi:MAG: Dam family site-specific DNA-(adenine-N6)-methyltransferase, partial [Anaerolineales bacterium]|nr:Dam family site-specific DNA-(adenine-N6)-methyltransferase [Anaerolineales bacterium]
HYFEPFIGSAAVFFHLQPRLATLSDRNQKLIEVYEAIQQDVSDVIAALRPHQNESEYYYRIRAQDLAQLTAVQRAARLIYLNKTCYNGLYRENRKGQFNVPFGRYHNPTICDEERLLAASDALQGVTLKTADFVEAVSTAEPGDFVYFDPPYVPLNQTSNFTDYSKYGFGEADQRRLADTICDLTRRGVRVMLSNSSAPLVYELYENGRYHLHEITARRNINSKASRRGPVKEMLILNYSMTNS